MRDYLDASAIVPIFVSEAVSASIRHFLAGASSSPLISSFVVAEVSSAVSRLVRTKRLSLEAANAALVDLDEWAETIDNPLEIDPSDVREATELVRQFELKLRAPDALHLAICRRLGARMVTLDNNLANACRTVDVAVINPAADGQADPQSETYRKT